jgi:23S rRNA pseudoU1915 N3-methylase RlmH
MDKSGKKRGTDGDEVEVDGEFLGLGVRVVGSLGCDAHDVHRLIGQQQYPSLPLPHPLVHIAVVTELYRLVSCIPSPTSSQ